MIRLTIRTVASVQGTVNESLGAFHTSAAHVYCFEGLLLGSTFILVTEDFGGWRMKFSSKFFVLQWRLLPRKIFRVIFGSSISGRLKSKCAYRKTFQSTYTDSTVHTFEHCMSHTSISADVLSAAGA